MAKKPSSDIICCKCGESQKPSVYYISKSILYQHYGRLPICKPCIEKLSDTFFEKHEDRKIAIYEMCKKLDMPFHNSVFEGASKEQDIQQMVSRYFTVLNSFRNKNGYADDFDSGEHIIDYIEEYQAEEELKITDEIIRFWGKGFQQDDYEYLNNFYYEYEKHFTTDTPVQINLYKNIAKVHLQAEKELNTGNVTNFNKLMELSSKLHNDGNIKPIQSTGANDDKGVSTYGLWIKEIEKTEPCEVFDKKPVYQDYDSFKKYWDKWFVRPFKNIFNISKDFDVGDDE